MNINITELIWTDKITELAWATVWKELTKSLDLKKSFRAKHSMIRSNVYQVVMENIPTFVSTHLVRHKIWVEHFVRTNRTDRWWAWNEEVNRNTPVNHTMVINAESLMTLANKRLCTQASVETRKVMNEIKDKIKELTPELAECMVVNCVEKAFCPEYKPCKYIDTKKAAKERALYIDDAPILNNN